MTFGDSSPLVALLKLDINSNTPGSELDTSRYLGVFCPLVALLELDINSKHVVPTEETSRKRIKSFLHPWFSA